MVDQGVEDVEHAQLPLLDLPDLVGGLVEERPLAALRAFHSYSNLNLEAIFTSFLKGLLLNAEGF